MTTFADGRQIDQGILQHTISGPGGTLSSIGPAAVHIDLVTGVSTDTGMEFSFHVLGQGVVFAQAGNFRERGRGLRVRGRDPKVRDPAGSEDRMVAHAPIIEKGARG